MRLGLFLQALFLPLRQPGQSLPSRLCRRARGFTSLLPIAPVTGGGEGNPGALAPAINLG